MPEGVPPLAPEDAVELRAAAGTLARWLCSPHDLEDLAVGWLIGEGYVSGSSEIGPLSVDEARLLVTLAAPSFDFSRSPAMPPTGPRREGPMLTRVLDDPGLLRPLFGAMFDAGTLRDLTGGVHTGCLVIDGTVRFVREDVSRHCVVDKLIGAGARAEQPLDGAILLLSGRISGVLAAKGARAGVCAMATMSIPTTLAGAIAHAAGMTLFGRARSGEPHIYAPGINGRA
ncbi:MAG: formate dehydrogenase accessory sulfurtransferase FdhD [Gemmatimonadota bacterium]